MSHRWVDPRAVGPMDDAAVFRPEGATSALLTTIDVITPVVDDAFTWGAIAAANALSDVYAMGGRPEIALAFVGFPVERVGLDVLGEVMRGLHEACARARCAVVGGHSVVDDEPKCGLAVIGSAPPDRIWSHRGARAGDALVLTKAIGTGIASQALRKDRASPELVARATAQMLALNDAARDVGIAHDAHAATDVTGFGLLGHLKHVVEGSHLDADLSFARVATLPDVLALARDACVPGGTRRNLEYARGVTQFDEGLDEAARLVLADAQTSGGLLLCLPPQSADAAVRELRDRGCSNACIVGGLTQAKAAPAIRVHGL